MTALARLLDGLGVALVAGIVVVLATGQLRLPGVTATRAENLLVALAFVVAVRAAFSAWTRSAAVRAPGSLASRALDLLRSHPRRVVVAGAAVYAVVMSFIVLTRHRALETHAFDLGVYLHTIWNIATGNGAATTLTPPGSHPVLGTLHEWGEHFSPVLYLLVPLPLVWPGAGPLLLAQTLILAAGSLAVFAFARRRLDDPTAAAMFAVLYLVNPSLHGINVRDIHPQAFAIPLIMAAALAVDAGRYGWCAAALVLVLGCREDAAIPVIGFGLWLMLARRRWAAGLAVAAVSLAVLALDVYVLMPHWSGGRYRHMLDRWVYLGTSLDQIAVSLVQPWRWWRAVVTPPKIVYVLAMLAPVGFLPLAAPAALAAALPGLAMNLLATDSVLFHYRSQYQAFVLPFVMLAAVEGYRWLTTFRWPERVWRASPAVLARIGMLASVVLTARTINDLTVTRVRLTPDQRAAYELMARIPPGATVSAHDRLVPHLATRPGVFLFPAGDLQRTLPNGVQGEYILERGQVAAQVPPDYVVAAREEAWVLWRRRNAQ